MSLHGQRAGTLLDVRSVSKIYPPALHALRRVSLTVEASTVVALLGANGAGKSTLTKILSGIEPATSGEIRLLGERAAFGDPRSAADAGVVAIHQELPLLPNLTAAENAVIGIGGPSLRRFRRAAARDLYQRHASAIPDAPAADLLVRDLSVAERQKVALVRALSLRPKLLIIDEGTSSVSLRERQQIYGLVRTIARDEGIGVIYITHFVEDALAVSDRMEILRDGRAVLSAPTVDLTKSDVLAAMSGSSSRDDEPAFTRGASQVRPSGPAPVAANMRSPGLVLGDLSTERVFGVDLSVGAGESVGIFGHPGCGGSELLQAIAGVRSYTGAISWQGHALPHSMSRRVRANVLYVSGDRGKNLFPRWSVLENATLVELNRKSLLARASTRQFRPAAQDMLDRFQVKGGLDSAVNQLSGGNQQKVILGRAASMGAPVLLLGDDPTRGVDVVARTSIHGMLGSAVEEGASMLIYSTDPDELLVTCRQIIILVEGRVTDRLSSASLTGAALERYAHSRSVEA